MKLILMYALFLAPLTWAGFDDVALENATVCSKRIISGPADFDTSLKYLEIMNELAQKPIFVLLYISHAPFDDPNHFYNVVAQIQRGLSSFTEQQQGICKLALEELSSALGFAMAKTPWPARTGTPFTLYTSSGSFPGTVHTINEGMMMPVAASRDDRRIMDRKHIQCLSACTECSRLNQENSHNSLHCETFDGGSIMAAGSVMGGVQDLVRMSSETDKTRLPFSNPAMAMSLTTSAVKFGFVEKFSHAKEMTIIYRFPVSLSSDYHKAILPSNRAVAREFIAKNAGFYHYDPSSVIAKYESCWVGGTWNPSAAPSS